jgi:S1-C subfamily serine protease
MLRFAIALLAILALPRTAPAQLATPELAAQRLQSVVRLRVSVPPDARTAESLGRVRSGSGVLIDQSGLILTIGYLMVEADGAEAALADGRTLAAQVVGYDHESGFGLLRTIEPPRLPAAPLGSSAGVESGQTLLAASFGGKDGALPARVVSRRVFAGGWEYMLDDAIFTAPPHPLWSGAALFDAGFRLVGIGSLAVGDADGTGRGGPGNMFVPIDRLPPILADMIADGAPAGPRRPWLGLSLDELRGRLFIGRVTPESPAARAGLRGGEMIVGIDGAMPRDLADFYRRLWAVGDAGAAVRLTILDGAGMRDTTVQSADRHSHLRLKRSY